MIKKGKNKILVTGAAGFIGSALIKRLLKEGETTSGIDNINSYYDQKLKESRLIELKDISKKYSNKFNFYKIQLEDENALKDVFKNESPNIVINLAAQAGVRYSLVNPKSYIQSNLVGFTNILEECKNNKIQNFVYASSSSVYGGNVNLPFDTDHAVDHPISLYAATKRANELMAHSYSHLFNLPTIGLRFFTVYGPWGRPDMAPMLFAKNILNKKPIDVFNYGNMKRDFTYIDDVIEAIVRCCYKPASKDDLFDPLEPCPSSSFAPFKIFNIGNDKPVNLLKFIEILEENLGVKAIKRYKPLQPGDVLATAADIKSLQDWINFKPFTPIEEGIKNFSEWYLNYYK